MSCDYCRVGGTAIIPTSITSPIHSLLDSPRFLIGPHAMCGLSMECWTAVRDLMSVCEKIEEERAPAVTVVMLPVTCPTCGVLVHDEHGWMGPAWYQCRDCKTSFMP